MMHKVSQAYHISMVEAVLWLRVEAGHWCSLIMRLLIAAAAARFSVAEHLEGVNQ